MEKTLKKNISYIYIGFPCGSDGKRTCLQCRRPGLDSWVGKIPWKRECLPTPVFLAAESWTEEPGRLQSVGHNESDTTEQLTHTRICIHIAESLCCTPETNTTLSINYTSV